VCRHPLSPLSTTQKGPVGDAALQLPSIPFHVANGPNPHTFSSTPIVRHAAPPLLSRASRSCTATWRTPRTRRAPRCSSGSRTTTAARRARCAR
jgi:hypothetical protein